MIYRYAIGLGSNLGDREQHLRDAADALRRLGRRVAISGLYATAPVGYTEQPEFLNAAALIEADFAPEPMLGRLLAIELRLGRDRTKGPPQGPRTVDLDILTAEDADGGFIVCDSPVLTLPHPRMAERRFVLAPLAEIVPQWRHPVTGRSILELLAESGGQVRRIESLTGLEVPA